MEFWDALDDDLNRIPGIILIREEIEKDWNLIPDGMYHLVCDVIVRHTDGEYLLMKRDPRKHNGGKWEATAGGSAVCGEDPVACITRELREETGICETNFTEIGRVWSEAGKPHLVYVEFLCVTDWPKDKISFQEGETCGYKWVKEDELKNMTGEVLTTHRIQQFVDGLH